MTSPAFLVVVNTYLGMNLPKGAAFTPSWLKYVLVAFALCYATTTLVLEAHKRLGTSKGKGHVTPFPGHFPSIFKSSWPSGRALGHHKGKGSFHSFHQYM
jgi:hypothetical protein